MLQDNIRGDLADVIRVRGTRPHTRVQRAEDPETAAPRRGQVTVSRRC